jgi:hypothetical protein
MLRRPKESAKMLPGPSRLREIAAGSKGSLEEAPFAALLAALALARRDVLLVMRRKKTERQIAFASGTPVDCRSNLLNETFGRFLVGQGKLSEEDFALAFAQSTTTKQRLGEALVDRGLFSKDEIAKLLHQNLARKLLDGFSWREGTYELMPDPPLVDAPFRVNVGQLILTGVSRFAVQASVDAATGMLVGKRLALGTEPLFPPGEIRMSESHARVAAALEKRPRIDELAVEAQLPFEEITRILYGLWLLGLVVTTEEAPPRREAARSERVPAPSTAPAAATVPVPAPPPPAARPAPPPQKVVDLRAAFDGLLDAAPHTLLDVPENAEEGAVRARYLARAREWEPWTLEGDDHAKATALFLAAARAYAKLADGPRAASAGEPPRQVKPISAARRFKISTDVLDPESQHKKGRELLAANDPARALQFLEFAADCDPQNGMFAADLTWARYLASGRSTSGSALGELEEAARIDPACGIAHFYLGEIHRSRGDHAKAEPAYRKAARLMAPDRRALDALRDMSRPREKGS